MESYRLIIVIFFLSVPLFISCERQTGRSKDTIPEEAGKETIREGTGTTVAYTQEEEKEVYQKLVENKVDEYHKKIDRLKAEAEEASEEVKAEYNLNIELLQNKVNVADKKVDELKYVSGKAWEDIKSGVEAVMDDFERHYDRVASRYK